MSMQEGHIPTLKLFADALLQDSTALSDKTGETASVWVANCRGHKVRMQFRRFGNGDTITPEGQLGVELVSDERVGTKQWKPKMSFDLQLEWRTKHVGIDYWHDSFRDIKLNQKTVVVAWKRFLLRLWAYMLPDAPICVYSARAAGDRKSSMKKLRTNSMQIVDDNEDEDDDEIDGDNDELEEEADDEEDGADTEEVSAHKETSLANVSTDNEGEAWDNFNLNPGEYDLYDNDTTGFLAHGWVTSHLPYGPPQDVLIAAKYKATVDNTTIEDTLMYKKWRSTISWGTEYPAKVDNRSSLDDRRETQRKRKAAAMETESKTTTKTDNKTNGSGGQEPRKGIKIPKRGPLKTWNGRAY
jgi:hypothetical protein